jgi:hypothetical protein
MSNSVVSLSWIIERAAEPPGLARNPRRRRIDKKRGEKSSSRARRANTGPEKRISHESNDN